MRVWLKFRRADELAFISHLDAHKAYYRMFRRADIPLALSQGFNPHPIMSLAAPLPLGFQSEADYLDIVLSSSMALQEISRRLSTVSGHEAFQLVGLRQVPQQGVSALAALVAWAEYNIDLKRAPGLVESIERFNSADSAVFTKQTKRGEREADAKGLVRRLDAERNVVNAILSMAEPIVFRPEELVSVLSSLVGEQWEIEVVSRRELYVREDGLVTPMQLRLG